MNKKELVKMRKALVYVIGITVFIYGASYFFDYFDLNQGDRTSNKDTSNQITTLKGKSKDIIYDVSDSFVFDGGISDWPERNKNYLEDQEKTEVEVFLGKTREGIVIAGDVHTRDEVWEAKDNSIWNKLVVGISLSPDKLRQSGWGHQFGDIDLIGNEICYTNSGLSERETNNCLDWYYDLPEYQDSLTASLLHRRWDISPSGIERVDFNNYIERLRTFTKNDKNIELALTDEVLPRFKYSKIGDSNFSYEILIPWESMPLNNSPEVDHIYIHVGESKTNNYKYDVELRNNPRDILEPSLSYGIQYSYFNLDEPRIHTLTSCDTKLQTFDQMSLAKDTYASYIRPSANSVIYDVYSFDIPRYGYQYSPEYLSPELDKADYYDVAIDEQYTLCGPILSILDKSTGEVIKTDETLSNPSYDGKDLTIKDVDDKRSLIINGPRQYSSYYGSGQCGACPRYGIDVYLFDKEEKTVVSIFSFHGISDIGSYPLDLRFDPKTIEIEIMAGKFNFAENYEDSYFSEDYVKHCFNSEKLDFEICDEYSGPAKYGDYYEF